MIRLIIKGTCGQAISACVARGIQVSSVKDWSLAHNETLLKVPDKYHLAVSRWFCEPTGKAPYPTGTLLHYSQEETVKAE